MSPACLVGQAAGKAADSLLASIGEGFVHAAAAVLEAVFAAISTATTIDLTAPYVTRNAAALASVALVLIVGLFILQVATAALRREPGALARAVTGAGVAVLGTAAVGTLTAALLAVVDAVCDGIAALAGTSIEAAARRLLDANALAGLTAVPGGPALMVLFGLLFILGATLVMGTLLVRQALIVIALVVAPLALAGATARLTRSWVHRWAQLTLALILSKLAIVVVFVVAVGLLGETSGVGGLLSGLILLLVACLSPWACFKVLDFAGTHAATDAHRGTTGATLAAANQARYAATSMVRTVAAIVGGPAGVGAGAAGAGAAGGGAAARAAASSGASAPAGAQVPSTAGSVGNGGSSGYRPSRPDSPGPGYGSSPAGPGGGAGTGPSAASSRPGASHAGPPGSARPTGSSSPAPTPAAPPPPGRAPAPKSATSPVLTGSVPPGLPPPATPPPPPQWSAPTPPPSSPSGGTP